MDVEALMQIERYSHVMHISSTVTGRLKAGLDAWDALRAALPAGTVSGAPKVLYYSKVFIYFASPSNMPAGRIGCFERAARPAGTVSGASKVCFSFRIAQQHACVADALKLSGSMAVEWSKRCMHILAFSLDRT